MCRCLTDCLLPHARYLILNVLITTKHSIMIFLKIQFTMTNNRFTEKTKTQILLNEFAFKPKIPSTTSLTLLNYTPSDQLNSNFRVHTNMIYLFMRYRSSHYL